MVTEWAAQVRPRVIAMENVEEIKTWGPLDDAGQPIAEQAGDTWRQWIASLELLGYRVEHRSLRACDYGAPTIRKRLFVVARRDGLPIVWPEPTHGPGRPLPWRTAAECIDWSEPTRSIFGRPKPLADATCRRIVGGLARFVLGPEARPFIVPVKTWGGGGNSERSLGEPLRSTTTSKGGEHALVVPHLDKLYGSARTGADVGAEARPFLLRLTHGGRLEPVDEPLRTITTAKRGEAALVAAFLARHNGTKDGHMALGSAINGPAGTVTAHDTHALATVGMSREAREGSARVAAFLIHYYSQGGQWGRLDEPLAAIVSRARTGLVTVSIDGEDWAVCDIGLRMLTPRELARAQGFREDYILTGTKAEQIARIGNSVPPQLAEAVVRANYPEAA